MLQEQGDSPIGRATVCVCGLGPCESALENIHERWGDRVAHFTDGDTENGQQTPKTVEAENRQGPELMQLPPKRADIPVSAEAQGDVSGADRGKGPLETKLCWELVLTILPTPLALCPHLLLRQDIKQVFCCFSWAMWTMKVTVGGQLVLSEAQRAGQEFPNS